MTIDLYTKVVMTIIAVSTSAIAINLTNPVKNVFASSEVHRIAICDQFGSRCADIDGRAVKIRNIGN